MGMGRKIGLQLPQLPPEDPASQESDMAASHTARVPTLGSVAQQQEVPSYAVKGLLLMSSAD